MKVLHMHFGKEGGAERFFVNLVTAFAEAGVEQRFVTRPGRVWKAEVAPLGPVIENHYRRLSLSSPILTWRVHRMVRQWRPDAIMAWMSRSSRLVPDWPHAVKLTRLGDYPRHLKHFRYNDLIVANTPGIAERCRELGWDRPLEVVSNFVRDVDPVPVDRARFDTPKDAFLVTGSGRFVNRKGFDTLLRAVADLPGAYLWLMGEGEKRDELEQLAGELGIADRVRFIGWVEEPMHYVAASDCFVMPSRHEPLGNVILEAWATGVPCVSTASEGPAWFCTDGSDSLLVPIDGVTEMAAAIARVRDEPGLAARLAENGAETLAARFTKSAVVDRYLAIFRGEIVPGDAQPQ
ncbi:glycosyltransferase [Rhodobacterales bacterium HKCCE3408]|nr:glycosyltransferase [Rhodobacterales bacterium HKCCE3408]